MHKRYLWVLAGALAFAGRVARPALAAAPAPVPAVVQAYPGAGAVLITYGSVADAVGYNVYRREVGQPKDKGVLVNAQGPTPYTWLIDAGPNDKGLPNGTHYLYSVKAVLKDASGKNAEGAASSDVLVTPQVPIAPGFFVYDIGTLTPSEVKLDGSTLTLRASGADILNQQDSGTFIGMPVVSDYSVSAKILEKPDAKTGGGEDMAKVGVMIRAGLSVGDPYAFLFVSANRDPGVLLEARKNVLAGGDAATESRNGTSQADTKFPIWLKLTREGAKISGFQSGDGSNFTKVGDPVDMNRLPPVTYAGLGATAHKEGGYVSAKIDAASVKIE